MNNFTYSIPTKIHFGKGQISHLSELSESGNKVLLSARTTFGNVPADLCSAGIEYKNLRSA